LGATAISESDNIPLFCREISTMGTWAVSSFGNDAAGDWVIALADNPTYAFLRQTLQDSIDSPDDSDTNASAVAAAEVLCIIDGHLL
jgi:hypothetical protein